MSVLAASSSQVLLGVLVEVQPGGSSVVTVVSSIRRNVDRVEPRRSATTLPGAV